MQDVGFAYNTTPEVVEYDEDGLAAPTVVAAAQRRSDSFSEAEAEAEAEFDVFAGLEDSEVFTIQNLTTYNQSLNDSHHYPSTKKKSSVYLCRSAGRGFSGHC